MNNKILFKFNYISGWGDTFLSIFDVVNCADFIKKNHPNYEIIFYINDHNNTKLLENVLNLEFFNNFFNEFKVLLPPYLFLDISGFCFYNNVKYKRIYSGRNTDVLNSISGIFDVFVPLEICETVENLKIPFVDFTFNDIDDRPKDFDVFNLDIVNSSNNFIKNNFDIDFESIYYRSLVPINQEKIFKFKELMDSVLSINKKYFMCSNSAFSKKIFSEGEFDIRFYRSLNDHDLNHTPDGFTRSLTDALFAVAELIILSKSNHIYYSGDMPYISLFNWYPINIKKIKLTNFLT